MGDRCRDQVAFPRCELVVRVHDVIQDHRASVLRAGWFFELSGQVLDVTLPVRALAAPVRAVPFPFGDCGLVITWSLPRQRQCSIWEYPASTARLRRPVVIPLSASGQPEACSGNRAQGRSRATFGPGRPAEPRGSLSSGPRGIDLKVLP